jgi:CRISPR/Cas system CMR subunit Cmr6 (Cas7 group RAMP superfamily)
MTTQTKISKAVTSAARTAANDFLGNEQKIAKLEGSAALKLVNSIAKVCHTKKECDGYLATYEEVLTEAGYKAAVSMTSKVKRIAYLMTNSNAKICKAHGIETPEQGEALVRSKLDDTTGIRPLYDALADPNTKKDAEPKPEDAAPSKPAQTDGEKTLADIVTPHLAQIWSEAKTAGKWTKQDVIECIADLLNADAG